MRKHRWFFYPLAVLAALILLLALFLLFLTVTEYKPEPVEPAQTGAVQELPALDGAQLRVLSFNVGFAGLGEDADFIMDGGKGSGRKDLETVNRNMAGISTILEQADADVYMLQEVDQKSSRTKDVNQLEGFSQVLPGYQWYYAPNFVCPFVPYPVQAPLGRIDSGVATYSRYQVTEATRVSLPVPFTWPVRTANLKRCMEVNRMPLADSDGELILINFHLEAYDDGEGKKAQTEQLIRLMEEEYQKGNYVVAGGDFNQTFPGVDIPMKPTTNWAPSTMPDLPEGWSYVFDTETPSCRLLNQPYQPDDELTQHYILDGFIVSPNLTVNHMETLDEGFRFSDHNPILMDITLN